MLPTESENPLYRTVDTSECKYPVYIPDRGLCLSHPEAEFVYTCLECDDMVMPFEVNEEVTPTPALHSFDIDFEDHFEIVVSDVPMCDRGNADFPFSTCTNEEVKGFFHFSTMMTRLRTS